jgi:sterol desaturase/sphingolipid hydroxylase (fatty acid hydroxylase superfamily)
MIDHSLKSPNFVTTQDSMASSSTETGPSGKPIVRTEEGIITEGSKVTWNKKAILWALPQPLLVAGSVLFVAAMLVNEWGGEYYRVWALVVSVSVTPLLLIAERFWAKKKSWLLKPDEMLEDVFWMASGGLLWGPIISDLYRTPVSEGFRSLRDISPLQIEFQPTTVLGLIGAMLVIRFTSSFFYYWLHRIQHESLFWWRMHATHHHLTKLSAMRGNRTHPFEYLALGLGTPMALALMGASDEVFIVSAAFGMWNGKFNHANLPMVSMPVWDWFFATSQQHHCHHAHERRQADSNYGCDIIFWDRVFGTYCGDAEVGPAGAGKGVRLSIKDQLMLAFYSDKRLKSL